ncbi:MAG: 4Fe-4S dicluster domain-containing protein [Desulfobacterales bacterium]|nr:4Fe-4S dicluster domain-containing protein [Desulfobacterales bacterium]
MMVVKIDKQKWSSGINQLKSTYDVYGPAKQGKTYEFQKLGSEQLPDLTVQNTTLSPKSIVFPQSEKMFSFHTDENKSGHHILKEMNNQSMPKAVLGIRPCDAKAFQLVKLNFDTCEYKDPYWIRAYESTTLIGLACNNPCSTCFCTSTGCGPFSETGLDVLLMDQGDSFIAKSLTPKGENLLKTATWSDSFDPATAESILKSGKEKAESKIASRVKTDQLASKSIMKIYEAPFWDDVAFSCINCGTCTFSCPTCWCFDIQDETKGCQGIRTRNWDTCMSPLFTLHGSGHNPRGEKTSRVRQRFMHKLKYFLDKYNQGIMCVGCGRCVRLCPVNIDIRQICNMMNSYQPS